MDKRIRKPTRRRASGDTRFHRAAECFPGVLVVYDARRRIRFINARGVELSGLAEKDILGKRDEELFPPATTGSYLPTLRQVEKTRRSRALETRITMPGGQCFHVEVQYVPILDSKGEITEILGITHDITEQRQLEQILHQRSRQLTQLISELTLSEHRERRRLAGLLHDHLQQLLVCAWMRVDFLLNHGRPCTRQDLGLLQRALDEALIASRSLTKDLAPPVSLRKDALSAFQWLARDMRKRYKLAVTIQAARIGDHVPEAVIVLLFAAARELLLNVAKHAGTRKAGLCLRRGRRWIELEVRDKGKGLDPDALLTPGEEHGFGIFSIRERAEMLGGKLAVDSAPGRGARVTLRLPLAASESRSGKSAPSRRK